MGMQLKINLSILCGILALGASSTRGPKLRFLSSEKITLRQHLQAAAAQTISIPIETPSGMSPADMKYPSVLLMDDGNIDQCPSGSLIPLETKKSSMSQLECSQLVQFSQNSNKTIKCGNIFVVKINPAGAPGSGVCSCCPPAPDNDCVNCLAGAPSVGWQTRPSTTKAKGWKAVQLAMTPPKAASCSNRAFAAWAAMATYKDGGATLPGGAMPRDENFFYMMQTAFFKNTGTWNPTNGTETDMASLWNRDGDCVLAFRGSDSMADFNNNLDQTPTSYFGLQGVHRGVKTEFAAIFGVMQMGNALTSIRKTCTKSVTVSGHALGGAVSQLFAVLANKIGDPLFAGITVDFHFGFGALPVGMTEFVNDKVPGGCFPGGLYYNMQKDTGGTSFIDILSHQGRQNGYNWVKAPKVLTWSSTEFKVVPCGEAMPVYKGLPPGTPALSVPQLALHDAAQYVDNVKCQDNSGLSPKTTPPLKPANVGVTLSANTSISQCPSGPSIALASGPMTPSSCAQLVRQKKLEGVCGNLYAVKPTAAPLLPLSHLAAEKALAAETSCSCCSPEPVTSCITCVAGSGNSGWETSPGLVLAGNWSTMLLTDSPPKPSTCTATSAGSWAAMAAYRAVPLMSVGIAYIANYEFMLKSAFWTVKAAWNAPNTSGAESDYAELWVKGGDCMLSFRGSDSAADKSNCQTLGKAMPYHGLSLNYGVGVEWNFVLAMLHKAKAFDTLRRACPKKVTVVGHSLGGAMAQMLAVTANMVGDPANIGLTVGDIYAFGALPIGNQKGQEPINGKSPDGCFGGGLYANVHDDGTGKTLIDPLFTLGMPAPSAYRHVKTMKYIMWSNSKKVVYKCGAKPDYQLKFKPAQKLMPLNEAGLYTNNMGC